MTITDDDDDIRALRERCLRDYFDNGNHARWDTINLCRIALTQRDHDARRRVSEIIHEWRAERAEGIP